MEDRLQNVRNWARQTNLRQFQAELARRLEPLGYRAELDMDRIRCYWVTVEKGVLGVRRREVKQPCGVIKRQDGSIAVLDADEEFVETLASVAPKA